MVAIIVLTVVLLAMAAVLAWLLSRHPGQRAFALLLASGLVVVLAVRVRVLLAWPDSGGGDLVDESGMLLFAVLVLVATALLVRSLRRAPPADATADGGAHGQADHAKAAFLANMSHELRTPLNAVIGFAQVMRHEYLGPLGSARYREYAVGIEESGQHLLDLIEDLLDVSRIETGQLSLREENLAPSDVMDSVVRLVRPKADGARVMLYHEPDQDLPDIRADSRRLRQVLLNLLSNAIKFTPAGGLIEVSGECTGGGGFAFVVRDTGIGIRPDDLEQVMSLFGQAEGVYSRSHPGPGLGLPIAHGLMRLHGGTLTVDSKPEHGTIIRAVLPPWRVVWTACKDDSDVSG